MLAKACHSARVKKCNKKRILPKYDTLFNDNHNVEANYAEPRLTLQRRSATPDQIASTSPNQAPWRNP